MGDFIIVLAIAAAAGLASPFGGYLAFVSKPHSLMLSVAVGFAGGVLLGTFAFEMMPEAISRLPIALVVICFIIGFAAIYARSISTSIAARWQDLRPRSADRWSDSTSAGSRVAPW